MVGRHEKREKGSIKTITTGSEKGSTLILLQNENGDNEIFWLRPHSARD